MTEVALNVRFEYKVINKMLMATRYKDAKGNVGAWRVQDNVFETAKAFLMWKYPKDMLPMIAPPITHDAYPRLEDWYNALSVPNSPYKRILKVSEQEYIDWVHSLDFNKPFDREACDKRFAISLGSAPKREVDPVEIVENENLEGNS